MPLTATLLFFVTLFLSFQAVAFPKQDLVPGGLAIIEIPAEHQGLKFTFDNKTVLVVKNKNKHYALVGLPLNLRPGEHFIQAKSSSNNGLHKKFFTTKNKKYKTQSITIKDKRKVNPYEKDMDRIIKEKRRKNKARQVFSSTPPDVDFLLPLKGINTGSFGKRRIFNGQARRPHSGMDIAAPKGTDIIAPANGTVIESGDFFFSGNIVYLDHGQGLITLYAHLNDISVSIGDKVKQGQVIGTVGETGRVTGPHLHWSLGLNGTWINPELFLPVAKQWTNKHLKSKMLVGCQHVNDRHPFHNRHSYRFLFLYAALR